MKQNSFTYEQLIDLPVGWSFFSTYILEDNMDVAHVLEPIVSDIIIVKKAEEIDKKNNLGVNSLNAKTININVPPAIQFKEPLTSFSCFQRLVVLSEVNKFLE